MEQLPSPDRAALLDELKRSPSPIAHALRVRLHDTDADGARNRRPRDTGRSTLVNGGLEGSPNWVAFAGAAQEGGSAGGGRDRGREERPDYLYLEHVLAKLSGSIHDPNWQVQRTGNVFLRACLVLQH